MAMQLTPEQQAMLDGAQGEVMAKVVKTLVMYGETFGATRMVPVTGEKGHLVTSFGLSMLDPVYKLMDQLIDADVLSGEAVGVHPCINTSSLGIRVADLTEKLIPAMGHEPTTVAL